MPGRVSSRSSDSVSSHVEDSSNASVYGDASYSVSRRNSDASEYLDAASSVSRSDEGNLSDLGAFEPNKVAKLFSFVFPKFSCFKQAYDESRNEDIIAEGAETERWNKQIEATIEELRKPELPALPLNVSTESPSLLVSVPAAISEEANGDGEAAELPSKGHDVEAIKNPFDAASFPHFRAEITLVRDTLDSTKLSVNEKIATLITLKQKTGTFPSTVKLMNLAEIMRDTARHESYEPVDRNQEKKEKLRLGKEAVEKSELELANCKYSYEKQKVLLDALLELKQPFNREQLEELRQRYLEVSEDNPSNTTFEKFVEALYDDQNQYLQALNNSVTASRNKIIEALDRRDKVKADCTSEFAYDWFTSSNSTEVFTNTFMDSYKQFNGSWNNTYFGDLFHWISDQLKDKSLNPLKKLGVIALQVASVSLYIIAKLVQTVVAPIAAFLASSFAVGGHFLYSGWQFFSISYSRRQIKIDAPKDEEQINKTRIADPNRKLVIATHFAHNPRNLAVKRVASSSILAPIPRRKGVRIKKLQKKVTLTPAATELLNQKLLQSHFREAVLAPNPQVEHRREALSSTSLASSTYDFHSALQTSVLLQNANGPVTTQRSNSALTKGISSSDLSESHRNLHLQSGGATAAASQGTSLHTKSHNLTTGHTSSSTFSHPKAYTVEEFLELSKDMRSANPRT